jgi:tRNA(Ile)-lysidine synthase
VVRAAAERLRGLADVTSGHVEDVLALAEEGRSGSELHLPGLEVTLSFGGIRFRSRPPARARKARERGYNGFEYRFTIPARVRIPECVGTLSARMAESSGEDWRVGNAPVGDAVVVGIDGGPPVLKVRSPRPGDRFRPLGAPGSKPLSRYLMERKVSRDLRSCVPLVVRADSPHKEEEILWVVGHGVSEASRVSAGSSRLSLTWVES